MIQFRQKDFSNYILEDTIKGAGMGLTAGSLGYAGVAPTKLPKWVPGSKIYNKEAGKEIKPVYDYIPTGKNGQGYWQERKDRYGKVYEETGNTFLGHNQKLLWVAGTTVLGAALGAISGIVKTVNDKYSQSRTNRRLLKQILPRLKSKGMVEGKDFTMDPKKANEIPTKICIVLSSASGELQTIINSIDDPNLRKTVDKVVKKSPGRSKVTTQNNRFNEITITTEKNAAANVNQVVSIIESFVESGYPVYIVEVG